VSVRNTKTSQNRIQQRRIQKLESAAPTGFSSVTRGQFRVASQEGLLVQGSQRVTGTLFIDGTERVDGTLVVAGTLNVTGTSTVSGNMAVTGPLTVRGNSTFIGPLRIEGTAAIVGPLRIEGNVDITGPLTISGAMTVTGDMKVTGAVTLNGKTVVNGQTELNGDTKLTGNLTVTSPGSIKVAKWTIGPGYQNGDGGILSTGTAYIGANETITLQTSTAITLVSNNGVNLRGGTHVFSGDGVKMISLPTIPTNTSGWAPIMINNSTGQLARGTS
jgi:cytoskeletal protein CcmA (bactofilin family)